MTQDNPNFTTNFTTVDAFRENLKDYAKDIRLNLSSVLSTEGAPGLNQKQILISALACAYAARTKGLAGAILSESASVIGDAEVEAAKAAATIMAMNNVFYRTQHFATHAEYKKLPARLRMNVIGKPGIEKADFEIACLAVSAIGGCEKCVNAHIEEVLKAGLPIEAAHSAVRIASTVQAASLAEWIG